MAIPLQDFADEDRFILLRKSIIESTDLKKESHLFMAFMSIQEFKRQVINVVVWGFAKAQ